MHVASDHLCKSCWAYWSVGAGNCCWIPCTVWFVIWLREIEFHYPWVSGLKNDDQCTQLWSSQCTEIALWWWFYGWWFWAAILNLVQVKVESNIHFFLSAYAYAKSVIYSVIEVSLFICRYNTLPSRRTLKNSRLVSKKDDVHVCIMCLRAIMNYQVCLCFWSLKKIWICQTPNLSFLVSLYYFCLK